MGDGKITNNKSSSSIKSKKSTPDVNTSEIKNSLNAGKTTPSNKSLKDSAQDAAFNMAGKFGGVAGKTAKKAKELSDKYESLRKIREVIQKIVKIVRKIVMHIKPILIITCIVLLVSKITIFAIGLTQVLGSTPHYYCELDADDVTKNSMFYKQYCATSSGMDLENLQGHYLTQDGSGPCTSCAFFNMYLRYFAKNGISLYDYMWDADGKTNKNITAGEGDMTLRHFSAMGGSSTDSRYTNNNNASNPVGSRQFAANHGISGANNANWGYILNEDTYDEWQDFNNNSDWVWDLSEPGVKKGDTDSNWAIHWNNGRTITIDGVTGTVVSIEGSLSEDELKKLLSTHPSGVELYGTYSGGGRHGILITKYDETDHQFYGVDSALGLAAGFEGPVNNPAYFWSTSYNEVMKNVIRYVYIEEDSN